MQYSDIFGFVRLDLLLITCLLSLLLVLRSYTTPKCNLPPGPFTLPYIGHPLVYIMSPHLALMKMCEKYGDLFSVRLGTKTFVVVSSGDSVREMLSKPECTTRPDQSVYMNANIQDPFFRNGLAWKEHKKFFLKTYKELNTENQLEDGIKGEVRKLLDVLQSQNGKPFDARKKVFSSVINSFSLVPFSEALKDSNKTAVDMFVIKIMKIVEASLIFVIYPGMKNVWIARKIFGLDKCAKLFSDATVLMKQLTEEEKELLKKKKRRNNYFSSYLQEMSKADSTNSTFSEGLLKHGVLTLYGAGTETVRDSLIWALYTMAVYQDVQRKIQKDIDEVVGPNRMPSYSDQKDMRFTQAVLMELHRWQTIIPLGIRIVAADTTFRDYELPKDTIILTNNWAVHHDAKCWKDPDEFIPERFISDDGLHILKNDNFIPFSTGKRSCLGEGIALMEVFLYFTGILQKFRLELPEGDKPNFDGFGALSYQMKYHKLRFIPRDS